MRQERIRAAVRQQVEASAIGLLELARIIGAVLLVLQFHDLTPVPVWAAVVLSFAPNLASAAVLAWTVARHRYVQWRVQRAVR